MCMYSVVLPLETIDSNTYCNDCMCYFQLCLGEIKRVFGNNTLEYIKQLCVGNYDNFIRLSNSLQIYIISFMELEDIATLSQTNKHFNQVFYCRFCQIQRTRYMCTILQPCLLPAPGFYFVNDFW